MVNYHERLDRTFAALVDPTRRAILARLEREDGASVSELARPFAIKLPAVMKHLDVLDDAGLITRSKVGRTVTVRLRPEPMQGSDRLAAPLRTLLVGEPRSARGLCRKQGSRSEERKDDDQSDPRAPDQGAALDCLRRADHAGGHRRWWGPDDGPVLVAETDPRVGGRFRVRFRMLDGSEHESSGEYLEVVKPERLSMSWRWTGGAEDPGESHLAFSASRRCRGHRTHLHPFAPARRGDPPQPRGRLDRRARQAGTPFSCRRTKLADERSSFDRRAQRRSPRREKPQRSTSHDHDLRFQMGSGLRPGPGARSARALGAGGSRPALQDAPPRAGRSGQTGLSRAAALRAGADLRGRRLRPLRIRSHRAPYRRAERDAPAEGRGRARTRDAMADRGAQFHRALRHERRR